jgi:hypothetical protein
MAFYKDYYSPRINYRTSQAWSTKYFVRYSPYSRSSFSLRTRKISQGESGSKVFEAENLPPFYRRQTPSQDLSKKSKVSLEFSQPRLYLELLVFEHYLV